MPQGIKYMFLQNLTDSFSDLLNFLPVWTAGITGVTIQQSADCDSSLLIVISSYFACTAGADYYGASHRLRTHMT